MRTLVFVFSLLFLSLNSTQATSAGDVLINEIAWMGTTNSANDEWIELYNNTNSPINLEGWTLKATDGTPEVKMAGMIPADGFYLLERTDDNSVINISADQIYTGALSNKGERLELYDNSENLIDFVDGSSGWTAGDNTTKQTMSRFDLNLWKSSKEPGGTPKTPNTFATEIVKAEPQSTEPQMTEVQPRPNSELAAVGQQTAQKTSLTLLIAGTLAIFSGITILILKKGLK